MVKYSQQEICNFLKYLSIVNNLKFCKRYFNLKQVSRTLNISTFKLNNITQKINKKEKQYSFNSVGRNKKLLPHHIEFLTSEQTVGNWEGYTLIQRCKLFHRQFPEVKISYSYLQRLYKHHKIRYKVVKQQKLTSKMCPLKLKELTLQMQNQIQEVINTQKKILFVDEAIFSPQTLLERSWSCKYANTMQLDMRNKIQTHALISAISIDKGLETFMIKKRSINQDDFIKFLQQINDIYKDKQVIIFMDNLSVHKTRRVKAAMNDFQQIPIYNVPYSPQYNGIESYFFLVKQKYKKQLLKNIKNNKNLNVKYMIKQSINAVQDYKTMNCVRGGINEIMKFN